MSVNKHVPHVLVLPEDDANRQLANGFLIELDQLRVGRRIQVLPVAGGWNRVLDSFQSEHVSAMDRYPERFMVLLIDFDGQGNRLNRAGRAIPPHLAARVFILGALSKPEALRKATGDTYETIGLAMARDCRDNTDTMWGHALLQHNATELDRLREQIRPILFP